MLARFISRRSTSWMCSVAAAALSLIGAANVAQAGTYSSLTAFQANSRGDSLLHAFAGPLNFNAPPQTVTGNGYAYTVNTTSGSRPLSIDSHGIGPDSLLDGGLITFSGKPVTAFAGTFFAESTVINTVAGTIQVSTDTGESFTFSVAAGGTFFGFTTSRPFTSVTFDTSPAANGTSEVVDNVYVGTSVVASIPSDQCTDAPTVIGASLAVPFDTTGATAENIPGSCAQIDTGPDVWVRYIAPSTGSVTMSTCGCTYDSILRAFDACGGSQIACNDDFCGMSTGVQRASQVQFRTIAGTAYLVRISGWAGASGSGVLSITATADCRADFNHDSATNVQDIFDFLSAWFAGCH